MRKWIQGTGQAIFREEQNMVKLSFGRLFGLLSWPGYSTERDQTRYCDGKRRRHHMPRVSSADGGAGTLVGDRACHVCHRHGAKTIEAVIGFQLVCNVPLCMGAITIGISCVALLGLRSAFTRGYRVIDWMCYSGIDGHNSAGVHCRHICRQPSVRTVFSGFQPTLLNSESLYIAIGHGDAPLRILYNTAINL